MARRIDSRRIRTFCETYGSTLFNVIQLAWALVLRCYTGTDDVCCGYLTSGRDIPLSGIENAVGLFINLLVCRLQSDSNLPILSILQRNESDFIRSLNPITNQGLGLKRRSYQGGEHQILGTVGSSHQCIRASRVLRRLRRQRSGGFQSFEHRIREWRNLLDH